MTLDYAIQYADNAKQAYRDALGHQSQLASMLGLGLIPLSAAALGLGIAGGSPTAIMALGLTGAAGYGTGTWLYSKPQQRAYVAGYNATTCAVQAVLPLVYVKRNSAEITRAVDDLTAATTAVESGMGVVQAALVQIGESPPGDLQALVTAAREQLKVSGQLLDVAYDTRSKVIKMTYEAEVAGGSLKEAVDRIAGQVSGLLVDTGPDLQALSSIVGGLAQSYGQFVRVPDEVRPSAAPQIARMQADMARKGLATPPLLHHLEALRSSTVTLQGAIRRVGDMVNAVTTSKPIETLKACGVSPEQVVIPLTIEPSALIEFTANTAATAGRLVRGGSAPYAVALQGDAVDGLTVRQTEPFGPAFVVQISTKTPAGDYTIAVADRAGQRQFVQVSVKGPVAAER
jgi:hypothetical protein